ncbi:MAG TPA: hypothetical protein VFQ25_04380 [Ktedonobacterales bacterium]|nr:hypothetical protein [Ktedonobacterales bacterium]
MKAIITQRRLLALLSGAPLVAIVALSALSLSQLQPEASGTTAGHAPSVSYHVSVAASATPDGAAPTPVGAGTKHGQPAATITPAPTASLSPASLPNGIAYRITGDNASVMGSYLVNTTSSAGLAAQIEMRDTGTATWPGDWSYYLGCVSNCMNGDKSPASNIAPGQSQTFTVELFPPMPFTTATYYSQWAMFHSGARFGEIATVKIVATLAIPLGVDSAPGCDGGDMTWTVVGGACANGGLALTASAAQEPTATLESAPSGFDDSNYYITVHAAFASATGAWVRLVGYNTGSSQCVGQGMDVRSDGYWRGFYIVNCVEYDSAWSSSPYSSSPIAVTLWLYNGGFYCFINSHPLENGGSLFTGGYPVISAGGTDGSVVTVADAELDTPVPYTAQWSVIHTWIQAMYHRRLNWRD